MREVAHDTSAATNRRCAKAIEMGASEAGRRQHCIAFLMYDYIATTQLEIYHIFRCRQVLDHFFSFLLISHLNYVGESFQLCSTTHLIMSAVMIYFFKVQRSGAFITREMS